MGVRGLLSYVKKRVPKLNALLTEPTRIGVDIHGFLYTWQDDLQAIRNFLDAFQKAGHTLVFVFDGEAADEKKEILRQRRERRDQAAIQCRALEAFLETAEGNTLDERSKDHLLRQIKSLKATAWHITKEYKQVILNELTLRNLQVHQAPREADDVLLHLEKTRQIDVILSSDMDYVRFGVNRIWIPHFQDTLYLCYDFDIPIFCASEDIPIEGLKDIAALCGSEVEKQSVSPSEAFGILRYYGSLENLLKVRPTYFQTSGHALSPQSRTTL